MGCGKTTVGQHLARLTGLSYVDLDAEIEFEQGKCAFQAFSQSMQR